MKDIFPSHYRLTKKQLTKLLDECVFVVDTNVLLNLYRYPQTAREDLLRILHRVSELNRLWLPYHAALEFQRNRLAVIAEQKKRFSQVKSVIGEIQGNLNKKLDDLQLRKRHSSIDPDMLIEDVATAFSHYMESLEKLEKEQIDVFDEDKILNEIDVIFKNKIGKPFSQNELDQIFIDGEKRYKNKQPPGYGDEKDKKGSFVFEGDLTIRREFGDLIIWREIIRYSADNNFDSLIFITDDVKDDWWLEVNGKTIGPRPELASELYASTNIKHFHMYKSEQFLKLASNQLGIVVDNKSVEQVKIITETAFQDFDRTIARRRGLELRSLYKNQCQVCGQKFFTTNSNSMVEVAHIMPLFMGGNTTFGNMLCLCPSHHRMFDKGTFSITDAYQLVGIPGQLVVHPKHLISPVSLKFHRENIFREPNILDGETQIPDDDVPF